MSLTESQQLQLLKLARDAILHGLRTGRMLVVKPSDYDPELQVPRATFVTMYIDHALRGCIGNLIAVQPLVIDVCENAYAAAFKDQRFPPLQLDEFAFLDIHISILTPNEPINFASEQDLLTQIRPGIDGLVLVEGGRRGTFLPSVWSSLKQPEQFLRHLKQKAGLPPDYWSDRIRISRYQTEEFGRLCSELES